MYTTSFWNLLLKVHQMIESTPKSEPFLTIDGQLGMLKKQISEMNARIEKLEKIIESKV